MQLTTAPFDKQDETLVPEAGSCISCPKRTGFNKLLFSDVRKDSCTDPQCFRAKVDTHVKKAMEKKPELVQISSAWSSRESAPLGRNSYVELELRKGKSQSQAAKVNPAQRPCDKMTEAIVTDGGKRGQIVKVCADPNCRVHHGDKPSAQQLQRERTEERKRIEKQKLAITVRHRVLAGILERAAAPIKKADLLLIAQYVIGSLPYNRAPMLAKRHKIDTEKSSTSAHEVLAKHVATFDESGLSRFLLEVSLIESAYSGSGKSDTDVLLRTAKRYRIDAERIQKSVAHEFAAKQKKKEQKTASSKTAHN